MKNSPTRFVLDEKIGNRRQHNSADSGPKPPARTCPNDRPIGAKNNGPTTRPVLPTNDDRKDRIQSSVRRCNQTTETRREIEATKDPGGRIHRIATMHASDADLTAPTKITDENAAEETDETATR